jgi:predicted CoA-binding protein
MSNKSVAEKLMIKPGRSVLLVNPFEGYLDLLGFLSEITVHLNETSNPVDIVQLFVKSQNELEEFLPKLKSSLKPGGMVWVTYTKGTSKLAGDIHRDTINAYAKSLGMEGIAIISIDKDWSALRLKVVG